MNISQELIPIEKQTSLLNRQNTEQNKSPPCPQEEEESCKRVCLPNLSTSLSASPSSEDLIRTIGEVRFPKSLQNQIPRPHLNFQTSPTKKTATTLLPNKSQYMKVFVGTKEIKIGVVFNYNNCEARRERYFFEEDAHSNLRCHRKPRSL